MYAIHTLAPRAQIYVFLYNCIQIYKICQSFIKVFYYTKVTILFERADKKALTGIIVSALLLLFLLKTEASPDIIEGEKNAA